MTTINWPHCAGQRRVKEVLEAAISDNSLGHAYLFSGDAGCGKFAAALDLALMLLCENKDPGRPCMKCASCTRVLHYAHPDFHVIMPVVLDKGHKGDDGTLKTEGWEYVAQCVKKRISNVYSLPDHEKVPVVPVEWIRELSHTILRGAHDGGANVAILDGIDSFNKESANSMLKLLEEPPAGTVLLLLTERPSAVLPTIVSRCQILRFSYSSPEEIRAELCGRLSLDPSDLPLDAVIHTGSLGRSLYLWNNPSDEVQKEACALWDLCRRKNWLELAECIDRLCEQGDYSMYERLFMELMQRVRNAFLRELDGTENLFLGGRSGGVDLQGTASHAQVERLSVLCERSIAAVKAHANMTLVLTHFAIALTETLNGEKQQHR
jgi:DNA polymerase III delta' subunit